MKTRNESRKATINFENVEILSPSQMNGISGQGGTEEIIYYDEDGRLVYEIIIKR